MCCGGPKLTYRRKVWFPIDAFGNLQPSINLQSLSISKFTKFNLRPNPDGSLKLESNSDADLGLRETLISAGEVSNGDVRGRAEETEEMISER